MEIVLFDLVCGRTGVIYGTITECRNLSEKLPVLKSTSEQHCQIYLGVKVAVKQIICTIKSETPVSEPRNLYGSSTAGKLTALKD